MKAAPGKVRLFAASLRDFSALCLFLALALSLPLLAASTRQEPWMVNADIAAHAAVAMRGKGLPARAIATRLGVDERQVARWLERDRAGQPLNPTGGRPGGCAGGVVA